MLKNNIETIRKNLLVLITVLAVSFLSVICPFTVIDAKADTASQTPAIGEEVISGDYTYVVYKDRKTIRITKYTGQDAELIIPSEIDGHSVIKIGEASFYRNKTLKSVYLPDSVQIISRSAFEDCTSLEKVKMSNSIKFIYRDAFRNCSSLKEITLPASLRGILSYAFYNCTSLKKVELNQGLETITWCAFDGCSSLEEIYMPDTVTFFGLFVFDGCKNLRKVKLSSNLERISQGSFRDCKSLKSITIPKNISRIGNQAFKNCSSMKKIVVQTKKLDASNVKKDAFLKTGSDNYKKLKVIVPKKKYSSYKKIFRDAGLSTKAKILKK